ncbi:MAG: hypothetical protein ACN4GK_12495 [Acidimicrobiia bacterium]
MVEVACGGGHAAAGEDAGRIMGNYMPSLSCGGSAPGGAVSDGHAGVGVCDDVSPRCPLGLLLGDLAGDVGDYWSVSG